MSDCEKVGCSNEASVRLLEQERKYGPQLRFCPQCATEALQENPELREVDT